MYRYDRPITKPTLDLAEAYVPPQVMGKIYGPKEALKKGTLFPELYIPYKPEKRHY